MPAVFDTRVLVRPTFVAADFTATKWDTADDKAAFANALCRFIASDFQHRLFTEKLYSRLSMSFGHIAHYSRHGFIGVFFADLRGKVEFLEQTIGCHPCGDPAWTFSDVERAVLKRLHACNLLTAYRAHRVAEIEAAERALLRHLQGKYAGGQPLARPPILLGPVPATANPVARKPSEQKSLF